MKFKPFFVHEHREPGPLPNRGARGFTVFVEPDALNPQNILVRTAFCSPKDQFCKAKGREIAKGKHGLLSMRPQMLPLQLAKSAEHVYQLPVIAEGNYYYLLKRMF